MIPNATIQLTILHEDKDLLVINKPAGLPVYPLKDTEKDTVANALVARYPALEKVGPPLQAGIVHRLDNTTSGLLVVARTQEIYDRLREIWNTDEVVKEYTALVLGIAPVSGVIDTPIAHHPSRKNRMMPCPTPSLAKEHQARPAHTEFKREKIIEMKCRGELNSPGAYAIRPYSLISVNITTGARHQIRVHLASIGHPLAGDKLYQNQEKRNEDGLNFEKPVLHLGKVVLKHPKTGKVHVFTVPHSYERMIYRLNNDGMAEPF